MMQSHTWESRKSGIDIGKYSSHSSKAASSTIKARIKGLSLCEINKVAGWKKTLTFRRFYDKPILKHLGT